MSCSLSVTVSRVLYPPATTQATLPHWFILLTNHGKCTGTMSWRPQDGEALTLAGEYSAYKGERQFKFSVARLDIPTNPRDQLAYVCARTSGLGPTAESLIWSHAGDQWQEIQSGDVARLSGKVYANFKLQIESLSSKCEESKVVAALIGKHCTMNLACKAWATWEDETLGVVGSDPYRLAELEGYGFRDIDTDIRRAYGIEDSDVRRIKAAVVYSLRRLTARGDTVALWEELYRQAIGLLGGYEAEITECTRAMFEDGTLKAFKGMGGVALAGDFRAENDIWSFVCGDSNTGDE